MYKLLCLIFLMCMCGSVTAAILNNTYVTYVGLQGDGRLFINFAHEVPEPGCNLARVDVLPNTPQLKAWMALATTAYVTGRRVKIKANGCDGDTPMLDGTVDSYSRLVP